MALKKLTRLYGLCCLPCEVKPEEDRQRLQGTGAVGKAQGPQFALDLQLRLGASLATPHLVVELAVWICLPMANGKHSVLLGEAPSLLCCQGHLHFFLPMSASAGSQGVGVCHLPITGQPGRVGTFMSCLLAAGTRLAAIREWELLRNLVPPSPGGCSSTSLGFDVGRCCTPPSLATGLQAPMGSFIRQFQEATGREQPSKAVL